MSESTPRTLVTAALIYANGPVHIGHLAGCYLPADIYVRYLRSRYGKGSVLFVSGTDEHGVAITLKARTEGLPPQAILERYYEPIRRTFQGMGISFDVFSQTHGNPNGSEIERLRHVLHTETSQGFFRAFIDQVPKPYRFVELTSEQFFDPEAQQFLADRYIVGTCPVCQNPQAYGDQCERCGSTLSPRELIHPRSALSGAQPVLKETTHWYLPLDNLQDWLENDYIPTQGAHWKANVVGQCKSWLKAGLQPRAMTRDLDWGVPVPSEIPGHAGKVLYVWFDAPVGYISATREWALQTGIPDAWKDWWLVDAPASTPETDGQIASDRRLVHFIGKDNIVFHGLIFPAMLHAHPGEAGRRFVVPTTVAANEFMNLEGQKISTSRNWAVWVHEYLEDFRHYPQYADMLRYYLTAIAPEQKDSDFSWKDFQKRVNDDLVGVLGNFVNRVLVLAHKGLQGRVPADIPFATTSAAFADIYPAIADCRFKEAQEAFFAFVREGNQYLSAHEPWKMPTDSPAYSDILYQAMQLAAAYAVVAEPFLPHTSAQLKAALGLTNVRLSDLPVLRPLLEPGKEVAAPFHLFKRVEDADIARQLAKLEARKTSPPAEQDSPAGVAPPLKPEVLFPDFEKLDLRVGTVMAAVTVPKADKLLQLTVDLGMEMRTIVSGIASYFAPAELVGQQVVVVANLAPRTLRGIASQGMVLLAETPEGRLQLVQPPVPVPNGSVVR